MEEALMAAPLLVTFAGGSDGEWRVESIAAVRGEGLADASRLAVIEGRADMPATPAWVLRGVTSNERYVSRVEHEQVVAKQPPLGRSEATRAALIPIRKSDAWCVSHDSCNSCRRRLSLDCGSGWWPALSAERGIRSGRSSA